MSLEKPTTSPLIPRKEEEATTTQEDPLYRMLSAEEEDSDWEYAFMGAIRNPSPTKAILSSDGEGITEEPKNVHENEISTPKCKKLRVIQPVPYNIPIEVRKSEPITEICELNVPVTSDVKPSGSLTIAVDDGADSQPVSCVAPLVDSLWSQEYISSSPGSTKILRSYSHSQAYNTAPLHIVEGRDDPEDEGICMTSPPPKVSETPIRSFETIEVKPSSSNVQTSPQKPEEFIDKCDILKWAIDDQDIGDMPGISGGQQHSSLPATLTSASQFTTSEQFAKPQALVDFTMTPIKEEIEETTTDSVPILSPRCKTPPAKRVLFEESIQSPPNAPKRKRGRPCTDLPTEITPKLPRMPGGRNASDSEYAYVSDCGDILTDDEVSALKYRRMRDLNNIASKRCRQTRKAKLAKNEEELQKLIEKNIELKTIVTKMEAKVKELKNKFLAEVTNPSAKIASARRKMIGQRLGFDSNMIGSFIDPSTNQLPDTNSLWAV